MDSNALTKLHPFAVYQKCLVVLNRLAVWENVAQGSRKDGGWSDGLRELTNELYHEFNARRKYPEALQHVPDCMPLTEDSRRIAKAREEVAWLMQQALQECQRTDCQTYSPQPTSRLPVAEQRPPGIAIRESEPGFLSATDVFKKLGIEQHEWRTARKRLERWRSGNLGANAFIQNRERTVGQSQFLYRLDNARMVLQDLIPKKCR